MYHFDLPFYMWPLLKLCCICYVLMYACCPSFLTAIIKVSSHYSDSDVSSVHNSYCFV